MNIEEVGTILYWCEGSKREYDCRVEFVNSDPRMISIFLQFIREKGIDEHRLKARMALHSQDDEGVCREYWKTVTRLSDHNFMSSVVKAPSVARKPLPFGTLTVRYNSIALLREIKRNISRLVDDLNVSA